MKKKKITQDYIDANIKNQFAIVINGTGSQRAIYCVIEGKLSQEILWHGKSFNEIEIPVDLKNQSGKLEITDKHYNKLLSESLKNSAYTLFANDVTTVLQEVTHDEHMSLGYYPYAIKHRIDSELFQNERLFDASTPVHMLVNEEIKKRVEDYGPHYGYTFFSEDISHDNVSVIPANVGYMKIQEIVNVLDPSMQHVKNYVFNLMKQFQDKDAIILDLRNCGGGTPQGVKYLASFFFTEPTLLCTYTGKNADGAPLEEALYTDPRLQSNGNEKVNLSMKPLYILIGEGSFSAAEELAYDLQQLGVAQLVGAQTKGGNHFTRAEPLLDDSGIGCDTRFIFLVPNCMSINPKSGTNWEDGPRKEGLSTGVIPNQPVSANENALQITLKLIRINSNLTPSTTSLFSVSQQMLSKKDSCEANTQSTQKMFNMGKK